MRCLFWCLLFLQSTSVCLAAVVGIDLGTHYVKEMVISPKAPMEMVLTPESKRKEVNGLLIKSYKKNGPLERFFGSPAASLATRFPSNTLLHLKSLLGLHYEENLSSYHKEHPGVELVNSEDRNTIAFLIEGQKAFPVEELVGMSLREYIKRADALLEENGDTDRTSSLALAIPEYFGQEQRRALLDACALTNLDNAYLCNEATAVMIDYALKQRNFEQGEQKLFVIYDMGAGSTKASLFSLQQPTNTDAPLKIEFLGYGHTKAISGSVLTLAISDILENKFLEINNNVRTEQFKSDAKARAKLVQAAEKAKLILSANSEAIVSIESVYGGIDFKTSIQRSQFEEYMEDLLPYVISPIYSAIESSFGRVPLTISDIDSVILIGGSTRVPLVQKKLEEQIGPNMLSKNVNADESIVNGVVIRGVQLSKEFKSKHIEVVERTTNSFGVGIAQLNERFEIFKKGMHYPEEKVIEVGEIESETLTIDLTEDDRIFQTVKIDLKPALKKYSDQKCSGGAVYNLTFSLNENKVFDLKSVEAVCLKGEVNNVENRQNNTDSNITSPVLAARKPLPFTKDGAYLKPLSSSQKLQIKRKLQDWEQRENDDLNFQMMLNNLEALLYQTREFLEDNLTIERGPSGDLGLLEEMVSEYLEWLDYDSEDANISEVEEKIVKISSLKGKIELYIKAFNEPLDEDQFRSYLEEAKKKLALQQLNRNVFLEEIMLLDDSFQAINLDVLEEYFKVKIPRNLHISDSDIELRLESVSAIMTKVTQLLESNSLTSTSREELFELKTLFENANEDLIDAIELSKASHLYRIRELKSLHARKLRVLKKREERKKEAEKPQATPSPGEANTKGHAHEREPEFEQDEL